MSDSRPDLTPSQYRTNYARGLEDLISTGKIGLVVLPAFALIEHYAPALPWPLIKELAFAIAAAFGVSLLSARATKARHAKKVTEPTFTGKKP